MESCLVVMKAVLWVGPLAYQMEAKMAPCWVEIWAVYWVVMTDRSRAVASAEQRAEWTADPWALQLGCEMVWTKADWSVGEMVVR